MKKASLLIDCQDHLGEGVLWSNTDQTLYWLDVPMPSKLHRLHLPTNKHDTFDMPEMITAMSVRPSGDLLIASHHGINNFSFEKKELLNINSLQSDGFEQHAEILCKVIRKGRKFFEVPTNYNGRTAIDGKKIRFYHIFPVLIKILTERIKNN